jgi:16S rRNA (guanine527-N7)-methyltransferase
VQLIKYLPSDINCLVDIGSGAGFPGVVLAILMQEKLPAAKVILVESITKKTVYLKDVCAKLGLTNTTVENSRIENISIKDIDVITARAVASLEVLCSYAFNLAAKNTRMLFLKGCSYAEEVSAAKQKWKFNLQVYPNLYCSDGAILELSNLRKIK